MSTDPLAKRYDQKELDEIEHYQIPGGPVNPAFRDFAARARLGRELSKFFDDEKPLAVIDRPPRGLARGPAFGPHGGADKTGQTSRPPSPTTAGGPLGRAPHTPARDKYRSVE